MLGKLLPNPKHTLAIPHSRGRVRGEPEGLSKGHQRHGRVELQGFLQAGEEHLWRDQQQPRVLCGKRVLPLRGQEASQEPGLQLREAAAPLSGTVGVLSFADCL